MRAARILVADDKAGMREGCREVLAAHGHHVDTAENGLEALLLVQEGGYDLLILDVKMPKADGLEVLRQARGVDPDVVCVVITGYATLELAVEATKLGAYGFLAKPFTPRELMAVVNKALEMRWLALEARRLLEERARNLLEIATEKSRLRTIINCMRDGVLVTNREGRVALVNPAAERLLAADHEPLLGLAYGDAVSAAGLRAAIAETLATGGASTMLSREVALGPTGETAAMANVAAIAEESPGGTGEVLGSVAVLHDITRLKELERVKEQFVRMVAHELRAPIAAISQNLDAILVGAVAGDAARQEQMLRRCQDRAGELLSLIEDLLRMSAIDAGRVARKVEPVDVVQAVAETVELFRAQAEVRRISVTTRVAPDLAPVRADRSDLGLVLTNLLSNALKYNREDGWVEVSATTSGSGLSVEVSDGGVGIPEALQAGIFKEFYRVKTPETSRVTGTGLGLSIVKRLVEAHHGRVWLRSQYGSGSTFGFWLPESAGAVP